MRHWYMLKLAIVLIAGLGLSACSFFSNAPVPQTPKEIYAATEITFAEVANVITDRYLDGTISDNTMRNLKKGINITNSLLKSANAALTANDLEKFQTLMATIKDIIDELKVFKYEEKTSNKGVTPHARSRDYASDGSTLGSYRRSRENFLYDCYRQKRKPRSYSGRTSYIESI